MLLEQLTENNIRPLIQFKNGKYFCRYRNPQKEIDREPKFANQEEAIEWRSTMITQYGPIKTKGPAAKSLFLRRNEKVISAASTLKDYINFWLKFVKDIPVKPAKSTIACVKHMLGYNLVRISVKKLDYTQLAEYMKQRGQSPTKPSASTLNIDFSAINRVINDVNTVFNISFDNDKIVKARLLLLKNGLIRGSGEKDRRLENGEWKLLLNGLYASKKSKQLRRGFTLMFRLYISTALRCSELLSLTWRDINFDASTLNVIILKQKGKRKGILKTLPLLDKTKQLFLKLRPENYNLDEPIFHVKSCTMTSAFTKAAASAELEGLSLHDLRTEGISRMLELGLPVPIVACFTGHRDHSIITRIYTNLNAQKVITNLGLIAQFNHKHANLMYK
jgi:integrase